MCSWASARTFDEVNVACILTSVYVVQDDSEAERSALVRDAALRGLDKIGKRGDADTLKNVLKGLLHPNAAIRRCVCAPLLS
jgi:hypothetical protein